MTIVCDKCGANDDWYESKETKSPPGQVTVECRRCSTTKVVPRFEYETWLKGVASRALVSAVGSISREGYAVAADARLVGLERSLDQWASLTDKDKSTLWSAMQPGTFTLYAATMVYLGQCAGKSIVPEWSLKNGQSMRTGGNDSGFGLGSAEFVLDNSWMSAAQIQRSEAARAKWKVLHCADIQALVDKLADTSTRISCLSQSEMRVLLRDAKRVWNDEQPHLSEHYRSSLQSVISTAWESIRPRWWEFHLKKRPKQVAQAD